MKKIAIINLSDARGGAAVVSRRLMHALRNLHYDARMVVVHKDTDDLSVDTSGSTEWRVKAAFMMENGRIYLANGHNRENMFKASAACAGLPLWKHPWVREADAIILNWVNQGMLSFKGLEKIFSMGKPVAWTMHDMWNFTGICHHAETCCKYRGVCNNCRLLHGTAATDDAQDCGKTVIHKDLSTSVQNRKQQLYRKFPEVKFVAVSNWLAQRARESSLLGQRHIDVIPNAFPDNIPYTPSRLRAQLQLPEHGPLIVMGAARLDDPIKDLPLAIDALNRLNYMYDSGDAPGERPVAVFFGALKNPRALDSLGLPYTWLGPVADHTRLAQIYAHAAVVISTSRYETLPGTVIEGIAAGAVAVATENGGQKDIIDAGETGFLVSRDTETAQAFARDIVRALQMDFSAEARHERALRMQQRFGWRKVANEYIKLLFKKFDI